MATEHRSGKQIFLLLGTNLGERDLNLANAMNFLKNEVGDILQSSRIYETAAWGNTNQQSFLNQAIEINTNLSPNLLLKTVKIIERKMGRTDTHNWGPRIIDIDILFYEDDIIETFDLVIPHPFLQQRRFALAPLSEIAEHFIHPKLKKSVAELLLNCDDHSAIRLF